MAVTRFRIIDADGHVMEPVGMWEPIPDTAKQKILWDNPAAFYALSA
jgi:hypothetical protein